MKILNFSKKYHNPKIFENQCPTIFGLFNSLAQAGGGGPYYMIFHYQKHTVLNYLCDICKMPVKYAGCRPLSFSIASFSQTDHFEVKTMVIFGDHKVNFIFYKITYIRPCFPVTPPPPFLNGPSLE